MSKPYVCNQLANHVQDLQARHDHVNKEPHRLTS